MRKIRFLSALGAAAALGLCVESCVEDVALGPSAHGDEPTGGEAGSPAGGSSGTGAAGGAPSDGGAAGNATGGSSGSGDAGGAGDGGTGGGTGGSSDTGGAGDGGTGGGEPPCDTSVGPAEDACIVSDAHAVFVAPDGDDDALGTKAAPVATFERAFELVENDARVVIACSGTYDEEVRVARGVRVYGAFDCQDEWAYTPASPSRVEPTGPGVALEVRDVDAPVVVEDMEFVAADATEPGASSMAGFVVNSAGATFRRVLFEAGKGAHGADAPPPMFVWPTAEELAGNDAQGTAGGARKQCSCPYAQDPDIPFPTLETAGGKGGDAQPGGQAGSDGEDYRPTMPGSHVPGPGGPGGAVGTCDPALQAGGSRSGVNFAAVGFEDGFGTLTASGWRPASSGHAAPGEPGKGGGGGASTSTAGGGGGGCGGCGGKGALGGQGGGASLGLVIVDTPVTLESSSVVAHDAGNGGNGAVGQLGQDGGAGGRAAPSACAGGPGGHGGQGGPGAGAVGGCSFGVLWTGAEPEITLTPITTGQAGMFGDGGEEGTRTGPPGIAAEVISVYDLL
jgi:hypothetical protein